VLVAPGPFNYSALNNRAAQAATGEYLCFLNNDVEAIAPEWLDDMVGYAAQEGVGGVGAKLYYADGTVQHAGVVLGIGGVAAHAFARQERTAHGYFGRLQIASNYSALTGACLLVRRAIFEDIGGFDEVDLAIAYNDIDLCLRMQEKGYRNVFTPFAELYHLESATRGSDQVPDKIGRFQREVAIMRRKHGDLIDDDPCYSPHLSRERNDFSVGNRGRCW
jgi:GT2 family glycosyltransferase